MPHSTATAARTVEATFCPTRLDDVRPEGWAHVGWRGTWQALWTIDHLDSPYFGQTMWCPVDAQDWFGWVPDEDLLDVDEVHLAR